MNKLAFCLAIFLFFLVTSCTEAPKVAKKIPAKHNVEIPPPPQPELTHREQWEKLVMENRSAPLRTKLVTVNEFFNRFEFVEDKYLWGRNDYWATLFETLNKSGGDCEDFSIAKYFTLRRLEIPDERMRLIYVKSLKLKQPHMVLSYYQDSSAEPLVQLTKSFCSPPIPRHLIGSLIC